jgi:lysine 2,3-aminomutase
MGALSVVDSTLPAPDGSEPPARDWRAQLRHAAKTAADLEALGLTLTPAEREGLAALDAQGGLPLGVTPHFAGLMNAGDENDPLRRQVIPRADEFLPTSWDRRDPLGEEDLEAVPFLVHRYPDRVLLLATDRCASYCRFCTRKRMVGQGPTPTWAHLQPALDYVAARPAIKEVIISGGDSMMLGDDRVADLFAALRAIGHLDVIRVASRMLAFCPTRVTPSLVKILRGDAAPGNGPATYWLSHFNHERELQHDDTAAAIAALVDGGVPILNQTVLLRGVNDDRDALLSLCRRLTRLRVRPYYLHQCDLAPGTDHFRVPLDEARALHASLRGHLSGISIPTFVIDLPGGLGKAPLAPEPVVEVTDDAFVLRGYQGQLVEYPRR